MHTAARFAILAGLALLLAAPSARAQTADESRLLQIAGQAASYAGEVRALLAKGASPNVPGQGGRTAVHGATHIGAAETMQALLEAGGKPNVRDEDGNAPLHFAAEITGEAVPSEPDTLWLHCGTDIRRMVCGAGETVPNPGGRRGAAAAIVHLAGCALAQRCGAHW